MLSRLLSIFSHKKATSPIAVTTAKKASETSLYDAICDELLARRFRSLPNGQAINGYVDADLYIHFVRNKHDIEVMIDCEEISVVVDEETDHPIERYMNMKDFSTTSDICTALCTLADELCGKP